MRLLVTLVISVLLGWPAGAQIEPWKQVGGWDVNVDRSLKNGCFILFKGTRGTVVRLGFTEDHDMHWFLARDDWKSLEGGKAPGSGPPAGGAPFAPRTGQPTGQKDPFQR